MSPKVQDTKLTRAIENIKLEFSKTDKKCTPEATDSLEQLNSATKLLETSKLWPTDFQQLSSLLRHGFTPLYKISLAPTLQYSITVFAVIHEERILPATEIEDHTTRGAWEGVQTSLLSGILDFLEEHPTNDNRTIVGVAIYPSLRIICNPRAPSPYIRLGSIILHTVYQLLSETVTAHLVNQCKLRDPDYLGGGQIGVIIAHTKDYLALEALLELFAKLLPSTKSKGGREKRTRFIGEVFNSSVLTCGAEITHILGSISSNDWELTSTKIMDALARADLAFPQPFDITHFQLRGSKSYSIDRLYLDCTGFVANIDEARELETFRALYPIIKTIKISASSSSRTRITLLFLSPPVVGQIAVVPPPDGEISVTFNIQSTDTITFADTLNTRGLKGLIAKSESKISKPVTHLDLDFDKKDTPIPTQDKVQNIQRLWNGGLSTSPLLIPISGDPQIQSSVSSPQNTTPPRKEIPLKEGKVSFDSSGEAYCSIPKRTRAIRPIVISDDESEDSVSATLKGKRKSDPPQQTKNLRKLERLGAGRTQTTLGADYKHFDSETDAETKEPPLKRSRRNEEKAKPEFPTRRLPAPKRYGRKGRTSSPIPTLEIDFDELPVPPTDQPVHGFPNLVKLHGNISALKRRGDKGAPLMKQIVVSEKTRKAKETESWSSPQGSQEKAVPQVNSSTMKVHKHQLNLKHEWSHDEKPSRRSARVANIKGKPKTTNPTNIDTIAPAGGLADSKALEVINLIRTDKTVSMEKSPISPIMCPQPCNAFQPSRETVQKASNCEGADSSCSTAERSLHTKSRIVPWTEKDFMQVVSPSNHPFLAALPENQLSDPNKNAWNPIKNSDIVSTLESPTHDAHLSVQEDYIIPIGAGSTLLDIPILDNDIVMIDLTRDSPKPNPKQPYDSHKNTRPEHLHTAKLRIPSPPTPLVAHPKSGPPHTVTFTQKDAYPNHILSSRTQGQIPLPHRKNETPPAFFASPFNHYQKRTIYHSNPANKTNRARNTDMDPTSKIVDIIGKITQVIVQNTSKRFDNVRNELRAGQMSILLETANDLEKMRIEGIDHFNTLVDLEAEYATHRRRIVNGFEDLAKISQDISGGLTITIQEHNRNSLSRKFSSTLFPSSLPDVLLNPKLVV
ncbi:hypothetical protein BDZ94DRAFT_1319635 [Collybia nuda]|uniref:Uncharacterized protein n=1 Tax=Collybia nuda TaxID=64659 RepID=A0A9P5YCX7_9AGAR|nr:hypothetical protein BDZ94DRAFT_1319635 [Collybia nuda]